VYARDVSRPVVFTVETAFADELKKPAIDFRRKDLFDFRSFNANRIQIVRDGKTSSFEKTKETDKDKTRATKWQETGPQKRDVNTDKFDTFLSRLSNLRATSFDGTAGTGNPVAEILVSYDDGKKEDRVTLSKSGTSAFGVRAGEPGVARLEVTALDEIMKALDEALAPAQPSGPAKD
jgi:hypothetical protein